jgi:hypothetical protein
MFRRQHLNALYEDLDAEWRGKPEYERLLRDTHLGIAYSDAGRPLDDIDPRVVALIDKHKPEG